MQTPANQTSLTVYYPIAFTVFPAAVATHVSGPTTTQADRPEVTLSTHTTYCKVLTLSSPVASGTSVIMVGY